MDHNYAYFFAEHLYWLLLLPVFLLSLYAQLKVSLSFGRYSRVENSRRMTGAQAAEALLRANGVSDVSIYRTRGHLTDHYDPRENAIYLSDGVYDEATVAAVGVACHEAGHAVQYAEGYGPVRLRSAIIPITNLGAKGSYLLLFIGLLLYSEALFLTGVVLFSFTTFFQLVTLPVEFNASARALETIESSGLLDEEEQRGAAKVLRAAALTYVAALLTSLLQMLRFLAIFASHSGNRRGGRR